MTSQSRTDTSRQSRGIGYLVAVIVNGILLLIVNVRPGWRDFPSLTEDFVSILWLVNLSLITSAVVNLVYLFYDPAWLKSVSQILVLVVGLTASIRMLQVFPFDFSAYSFPFETLTRVLLVLAVFGSVVAIVVELVKLARLTGNQTSTGARPRSLHRH